MDELCLVMKGKKNWLWQAVDQEGYELDIFYNLTGARRLLSGNY